MQGSGKLTKIKKIGGIERKYIYEGEFYNGKKHG